jgi:hypothetical protein
METMTEPNTEKPVDELSKRVDRGFDKVDTDVREVRGQIRGLRTEVKAEFKDLQTETKSEIKDLRADMNNGFARVDAKFDSLNRTVIYLLGGSLSVVTTGLIAAAFHLFS